MRIRVCRFALKTSICGNPFTVVDRLNPGLPACGRPRTSCCSQALADGLQKRGWVGWTLNDRCANGFQRQAVTVVLAQLADKAAALHLRHPRFAQQRLTRFPKLAL